MPAVSPVPAPTSAPVTVPTPGRHTEIEKLDLSYKVLKHIDNGQNEEKTLVKHEIWMDFGGGKVVTFDMESYNLDATLKAMEMFGREIKDWDKQEFDKYVNAMEGKWIWFNITDQNPKSPVKSDQITAFKADRSGRTLEYAFPEGKNFKAGPAVLLEDKYIKQIHKLAKLLRARQDDAADAKREAEINDLMVSLEQIN